MTLTLEPSPRQDEPQRAQKRVLRFLGLPSPVRGGAPAAEYAEAHAASLQGGVAKVRPGREEPWMGATSRGARAEVAPMLNATRHRLQTFYAPHNRRLAALLGDQRFLWGAE